MTEKKYTPKISALAITLNEAENVKRYVESVSFADEILFIDSQSTDDTVIIAKEMGVTVIQRKFDNFSNQRNFAISQAKNDWIIFFDLDEILSEEVQIELQNKARNPRDCVAFFIKRNFFLLNKHLKHGGFQNDKAIRLFNKKYCSYNGNLVHEEIKTNGKIGILKHSIDHYSYKNFDHYYNKLDFYSKLQATKLHQRKKNATIYHFTIKPSYRFFWQYFYRLGILDGKEGLLSAKVNSYFVFKKYLKLWMLHNKLE